MSGGNCEIPLTVTKPVGSNGYSYGAFFRNVEIQDIQGNKSI